MKRFKIILCISILFLLAVMLWGLFSEISTIWYLIPITLFFLATIIGSFSMGYNVFLLSITQNKSTSKKIVAITFDDGPNTEYTPKILDILKRYSATATFFCIGKNMYKNPQEVTQIIASGHAIGNHSYSHSNLIGFSSGSKWKDEIEKTDDILHDIAGLKPKFFRPPFGVTTPNLAKAIKATGHKAIGWNVRSFDTTTKNPSNVLNRITKRVKSGSIILLHDTHNRCPYILEHLLIFLQNNNYKTVSLETLLDET